MFSGSLRGFNGLGREMSRIECGDIRDLCLPITGSGLSPGVLASRSEVSMGNGGWYGTQEEWQRVETPIKTLDPELERFADLHGLSITRNHKDWPDRSMVWDAGARCLIQLYLADAETLGINLWICTSQDRERERYWKHEFLCERAPLGDLISCLPRLLSTAKMKLDGWAAHPEQLEFATTIPKI